MRAILLIGLAACGVGDNTTPQPEAPPDVDFCVPNRDREITAAELPIALGETVPTYVSKPGAPVDLVGDDTGWRLDSESVDDVITSIGPVPLATQWYAAQFPEGRFVVEAADGLDAIYHQDEQALWLDGTASQEASITLVRYADPVALLRFPLRDGDRAELTAALPDATIEGLPFIGTDDFTIDVTVRDHLIVPYVDFSPVHRVRTTITRKATGTMVSVTKRATLFMFECFGEVARAEAATNEPSPDFTSAAYLRRFALGRTPP